MNKYLTIGQAAEKLGVSSQTLRRWDKSAKLKSIRHPMNNFRVYSEEQINTIVLGMESEFSVENSQFKEEILPYFTTKQGELYNCDVIEFFNGIESESIELIFADPPYNIKKAEWDTFESQKKYIEWSMKWINEAHRVLSPNGSLYVCGFSEILADIKWAASDLFEGCKWLVWFYRNKANLGNDWGRSHESILHFRKSKEVIFNIDEVRIPYNEHTLKYPQRKQAESSQYSNGGKKYIWNPNPLGAKPKDVLEIPTIANGAWEKFKHPTQKPIELVKRIILASSNINSLVVDPFGGSGTTYAVAEAFQRKWLGCELNPEYCDVIETRLFDEKHIDRIRNGTDSIKSQKLRKKLRG